MPKFTDKTKPGPSVAGPVLLIRSFEGDNGVRPFSQEIYWDSPDIELWVMENGTSVQANEWDLQPGIEHFIKVRISNIGTLPAFGTVVEIYVMDPTCENATALEMEIVDIQVLATPIACGATVEVLSQNPWVPSEEYVHNFQGHACVIARAYVPVFGIPSNFECRQFPNVAQQNLAYVWTEPETMFLAPFRAFSDNDEGPFRFMIRTNRTTASTKSLTIFEPHRWGLLRAPADLGIKDAARIAAACREAMQPKQLNIRTSKIRRLMMPRKQLIISPDQMRKQRHLWAMVEVPSDVPSDSQFIFHITKWRGKEMIGGLSYVLRVRGQKQRSSEFPKRRRDTLARRRLQRR